MSDETNKALLRRWFEEVWNQGRLDTIDAMLTPQSVVHGLGDPMTGPDGFKPFHATFREAYPDLHVTLDEMVAEGDLIAVRWTATGTHRGSSLGFPATGRSVNVTGMAFVRAQNGQILEAWNRFDELGMMRQLGRA